MYDDRTDPAELAHAVSRFLSVESCGQCAACKLGTARITDILEEVTAGSDGGLVEMSARLGNVTDSARCFLPSQEQRLVRSLLPDMRSPELRTERRGLVITKIVDLDGDRFVLDDRQRLKRPDWTYEAE